MGLSLGIALGVAKSNGDVSYLGSFSSIEDLKKEYPEGKIKTGNHNPKSSGCKKLDNNAWAIVDDGINTPINYKYNNKRKWMPMEGGSAPTNNLPLVYTKEELEEGQSGIVIERKQILYTNEFPNKFPKYKLGKNQIGFSCKFKLDFSESDQALLSDVATWTYFDLEDKSKVVLKVEYSTIDGSSKEYTIDTSATCEIQPSSVYTPDENISIESDKTWNFNATITENDVLEIRLTDPNLGIWGANLPNAKRIGEEEERWVGCNEGNLPTLKELCNIVMITYDEIDGNKVYKNIDETLGYISEARLSTKQQNNLVDVLDPIAIHKYAHLTLDFKTMFIRSGKYRCFNMTDNILPDQIIGDNDAYVDVYVTDENFILLEAVNVRTSNKFTLSKMSGQWGEWIEDNTFNRLNLKDAINPPSAHYDSKNFGYTQIFKVDSGEGMGLDIANLLSDLDISSNKKDGIRSHYFSKQVEMNLQPHPSATPIAGEGWVHKLTTPKDANVVIGFVFLTTGKTKINVRLVNMDSQEIALDKNFEFNVVSETPTPTYAMVSKTINNISTIPQADYELIVTKTEGNLYGVDEFPFCTFVLGKLEYDYIAHMSNLKNQVKLKTSDRCFILSDDNPNEIRGFIDDIDGEIRCDEITIPYVISNNLIDSIADGAFRQEDIDGRIVFIEADLQNIGTEVFRNDRGEQIVEIYVNPNLGTYYNMNWLGYDIKPTTDLLLPTINDSILVGQSNGSTNWRLNSIRDKCVYLSPAMRIRTDDSMFIFEKKSSSSWIEVNKF